MWVIETDRQKRVLVPTQQSGHSVTFLPAKAGNRPLAPLCNCFVYYPATVCAESLQWVRFTFKRNLHRTQLILNTQGIPLRKNLSRRRKGRALKHDFPGPMRC